MKGKLIGRKKTRPSELIRALLKKNLPYRTIAAVTGSSHGSVWAEKRALLLEEAEAKRKQAEQPPVISGGALFPDVAVELRPVDVGKDQKTTA